MRKTIACIWLALFFVLQVAAQDKFVFPKSTDIGLNITNVLSSFIGNSNGDLDVESFPLIIKVNRKKNAFRFGLGVELIGSDDLFVNVEQFILNNYQINTRIGFERKKYIGNRFGFFYGADFIAMYRNEENTFSNSIDVTNIIVSTLGFGGGPVYGFEYYLNKSFYLGAEGSFYGLYSTSKRSELFRFNPSLNTDRRINGYNASLSAPTRLYAMVRF